MNNCLICMFSKYTRTTSKLLEDLEISFKRDKYDARCDNEKSVYYDEIISSNLSCDLFIDYNKYIIKKDRKNKINKINNND